MIDPQSATHEVVGETDELLDPKDPKTSAHPSDSRKGQLSVAFYEDGDVVVVHGKRGLVTDMSDVSGYDPILNALTTLDVPQDLHDDVLDVVQDELGG